VLVVTHSLTHLDTCDQVVFLTPGGKIAYCGAAIRHRFGHGHHGLGRSVSPESVADPRRGPIGRFRTRAGTHVATAPPGKARV